MSILDWLGLGRAQERRGDDVVHRIAAELEAMEPESARRLALFAFLLARVAHVDLAIGEGETREMQRILERVGRLAPAQAALVVEIAKAQNRLFGSTWNHLAGREYAALATAEQKQDLLHCMFAIAAAEDAISVVEEEEIRVVARQLGFTDAEYVAMRLAWREHRAVLRDPRGGER